MQSLNEPGGHSSGYKSKSIAEQSLAELWFPELNANQLRMLEKHLLEIVGDDYEPQFKDNRLVQVYTDGINSTRQTIRRGISHFVGADHD